MRVCENVHVHKAVWEVCVHYWGKVLAPARQRPCSGKAFRPHFFFYLFNLFVPMYNEYFTGVQ